MPDLILLIDDDEALLELLSAYLEDEGYRVVTATSGSEGIRRAFEEPPDAVVLDIMMPRMDGWVTAQRLREMSDVPLIMLTAKTTEHDKLRGFQLGTDDYVTKPFSFAELTARLGALLARARRAEESLANQQHVTLGDLEIDLEGRRVTRRGKPVSLTPTEFRLLGFLARHMGTTLSQDRLMAEVWGPVTDYTPGYVRRYIWYLRQKLEDDPENPRYLHTERGFGYRLGLE